MSPTVRRCSKRSGPEELAPSLLAAKGELSALKVKEKKLLDACLDGAVPSEVYRERAEELQGMRRALERRISEASKNEL